MVWESDTKTPGNPARRAAESILKPGRTLLLIALFGSQVSIGTPNMEEIKMHGNKFVKQKWCCLHLMISHPWKYSRTVNYKYGPLPPSDDQHPLKVFHDCHLQYGPLSSSDDQPSWKYSRTVRWQYGPFPPSLISHPLKHSKTVRSVLSFSAIKDKHTVSLHLSLFLYNIELHSILFRWANYLFYLRSKYLCNSNLLHYAK